MGFSSTVPCLEIPSANSDRLPSSVKLPTLAGPTLPVFTIPNSLNHLWPGAPDVRLPPLESRAWTTFPYPSPPANINPFPQLWLADPSMKMPPLVAQAQSSHIPPQLSLSFPVASQAPGAVANTGPPTFPTPTPDYFSQSMLPQAKSPFSLFTATQMPIPPNAIALEPPLVASNERRFYQVRIYHLSFVCFPLPIPIARSIAATSLSPLKKNQYIIPNPVIFRILHHFRQIYRGYLHCHYCEILWEKQSSHYPMGITFLHLPQAVCSKMRCLNCPMEPVPILRCAGHGSPQ